MTGRALQPRSQRASAGTFVEWELLFSPKSFSFSIAIFLNMFACTDIITFAPRAHDTCMHTSRGMSYTVCHGDLHMGDALSQ